MTSKSLRTRLCLAGAIVIVVLGLVPVASGGGPKDSSASALSVASSSVPAWTSFSAAGCGYSSSMPANVAVGSPYWNAGFSVPVDANGCISFMFWVDGPGTYTIRTYQNMKGNKQTLIASASVSVV